MAGSLSKKRSTTADSSLLDDAKRFGMSAEDIASLSLAEASGHGAEAVWRANEPAVRAFVFTATQWRTAQLTTETGARIYWVGLDYAGVRAGLEGLQIPVTPNLWAGLMVMEQEARSALNGDG